MRARAAILFVAVVAGGCAGENLSQLQQQQTAVLGVAATPDDAGPFNPFGMETKAPGGREVIENPTMADVLAPASPLPEMAWGKADAPVTLVKYASMTCPHCRKFHAEVYPELKRSYIDTGKVRFILREFPIGKQSGTATIALRCAKPEKYLDLYGRLMKQQAAWVSQEVRPDPIFKIAQLVGMTRAEFDACLANQAMIGGLTAIKDRGRKLGVIGTPNFFVQNRLVKSTVGVRELRELIDPLLNAPAVSAAAP